MRRCSDDVTDGRKRNFIVVKKYERCRNATLFLLEKTVDGLAESQYMCDCLISKVDLKYSY